MLRQRLTPPFAGRDYCLIFRLPLSLVSGWQLGHAAHCVEELTTSLHNAPESTSAASDAISTCDSHSSVI